MAFVSQSKRVVQFCPKAKEDQRYIGPGSYNIQPDQQKKYHSAAPFISTSSKKDHHPKFILPGPGQYKVNNSLGKPIIKTYTNTKSVIIKINSTLQTFASKSKRFKSQQNTVPGPGQYLFDDKSLEKKKKKRLQQTKIRVISMKNAPSIPKNYLLNQPISTKQTSNDDQIDKLLTNKRGSLVGVWGKNRVQRFCRSSSKCHTELGPGKYNIDFNDHKHKFNNQSYNFSSNTVKSIFDTIYYDTLNQNTLDKRMNIKFKSGVPAPGDYDPDMKDIQQSNNFKYKNRTFGSSNARFQEKIDQQASLPFYDFHLDKKTSFNKKPIPFNTQSYRIQIDKEKLLIPGPGSYQNYNNGEFNRIKPRIQNFGSFVPRPFFEESQTEKVGPGSYSLQPKKRNTQLQNQSVIFKSKMPRLSTQPSVKSHSDKKFGAYDVQREDISRKILEEKIYRQNLQKIQCEKPAFDRKSPRFKHYEEQTQQIPTFKEIIVKHSHKIKEKKEDLRQKLITQARNQIFEKKGPTIGRGGQRFEGPKKCPGVGDYSIRQKWTKKSYNIKYSKAK